MMLQAAASNTGLRAVVSEGAGVRSVREDLLRGPRGWFALPEAAVQSAALAVMSGAAPPPSLDDLVPRISSTPALPRSTPVTAAAARSSTPTTTEAAAQPKTLWKIAEAGHVGGFHARPDEYEERVTRFFDRALLEQDDERRSRTPTSAEGETTAASVA